MLTALIEGVVSRSARQSVLADATDPPSQREASMLQITADMFSGRPNPTWLVEADEANDLLQEIAKNRSAIGGVSEGFQGLGYRGLVVEVLIDNIAGKHDLPHTFRIGHNADANGLAIAERVLGSMQKAKVMEKGLHALVAEELKRQGAIAKPQEEISEVDHPAPPAASTASGAEKAGGAAAKTVTCWIELGHFNPGFWNDAAHIGANNCYNYASNRRTNTFAQPGRATDHQATVMACDKVTAGAISDGLHHRYNCFPDSEKPRWLMALVVAPGYDYHWYRKQQEGFWGHKPGGTAARNYDNNGAVIMNPETAARGPYTNFCGYFYACKSQKIS
jgi:hypothetical protein